MQHLRFWFLQGCWLHLQSNSQSFHSNTRMALQASEGVKLSTLGYIYRIYLYDKVYRLGRLCLGKKKKLVGLELLGCREPCQCCSSGELQACWWGGHQRGCWWFGIWLILSEHKFVAELSQIKPCPHNYPDTPNTFRVAFFFCKKWLQYLETQIERPVWVWKSMAKEDAVSCIAWQQSDSFINSHASVCD